MLPSKLLAPNPEGLPSPTLGSYGNPSIDQHDAHFLAASRAVERKKGIQVNPRFLKALMGLESGENGNYPVSRCRESDGYPGPRSCGPMQIKWPYHRQRCPECDQRTVAGHIEMAAHIIGDTMRTSGVDEYGAYTRAYLTADDINGTTQQEAVQGLKRRVRQMDADAGPTGPEPPVIAFPPEPAPPLDPWRPYPWPKMVDLIVTKPGERAGFDRCQLRAGRIAGKCTHITDGEASIEWYRDFFSTGGERAWDALTDFVLGRDGRLGLLNDWRDPNRGGTRAGWANGGVDGLEGIGIAFYRAFPAINEVLLSVETVARDGQAWTDAQLEIHIEMSVAIAQNEAKIHYSTYPVKDGVDREQSHYNFATKRCAGEPYRSTYREVIIREAREKLAAWQGGAPLPEPEPVLTYTDYGLTLETVANLFGTMDRYNEDGSIEELPFNPTGPLSMLWLKRAEEEGNFPEAESIQLLDSTLTEGRDWLATFEGGWVAILPAGDTRASWVWLDQLKRGAA